MSHNPSLTALLLEKHQVQLLRGPTLPNFSELGAHRQKRGSFLPPWGSVSCSFMWSHCCLCWQGQTLLLKAEQRSVVWLHFHIFRDKQLLTSSFRMTHIAQIQLLTQHVKSPETMLPVRHDAFTPAILQRLQAPDTAHATVGNACTKFWAMLHINNFFNLIWKLINEFTAAVTSLNCRIPSPSF